MLHPYGHGVAHDHSTTGNLMTRPQFTNVERVGIIGAGVIGGGWAAHFLRQGMQVKVWDPAPDAEEKFRERLETTVWPTLEKLGLHPDAKAENVIFTETLAEAVADAQFIQENTPERLPIKISTLQAIDAAAPADTIIASSTSGYLMSEMAIDLKHPERCTVAHPFNPPYLMPVVEVVAGPETSDEAHQWAVDFYRHTGHGSGLARDLTYDRQRYGHSRRDRHGGSLRPWLALGAHGTTYRATSWRWRRGHGSPDSSIWPVVASALDFPRSPGADRRAGPKGHRRLRTTH